jgi:thiol-disulfide isomerase/thioredoxin
MKSKILFCIAFLAISFAQKISAQGIEFFHGTWPEALAKAKAEEKLIFVDAYASWCGPCKRMSAQTFPDPKAGDFFNSNFINMKIDMEKPENDEFASKYPVGSYPTLMFISADGKIAVKDIGAKGVPELLEFGQKALGTTDKSKDFEEKYTAGERDPQFLLKYVKALNQFGKPSLKITNDYLKTQTDFSSEFNLRFIHEGAVEADSRVFDLLIKNRDKITALTSESAVKSKIELACKNTAKKAIEFRSEALLKEANTKMAANYPAQAEKFIYTNNTKYFTATKDSKNYLKAVSGYQKKEVKNNAALLQDLVVEMLRAFPEDTKVLKKAEKWAKSSAETGGLPEYYMNLADVYRRLGDKAKARTTAEKALNLVGDKKPDMAQKIDWFLQQLNEQ